MSNALVSQSRERWHVDVRDGMFRRRFVFTDKEKAWNCLTSALQAGFDAKMQKAQVHK